MLEKRCHKYRVGRLIELLRCAIFPTPFQNSPNFVAYFRPNPTQNPGLIYLGPALVPYNENRKLSSSLLVPRLSRFTSKVLKGERYGENPRISFNAKFTFISTSQNIELASKEELRD